MNILDAMNDAQVFGDWFGPSWDAWRAFLAALFGLAMTDEQRAAYRKHTGRATAPREPFSEAWVVAGRRGGKSLMAALVAVFLACFRDYRQYLKPGEVGTVAVIAADRKQARNIMRYIRGFLGIALLHSFVVNDTAECIELDNRVVIEVHTASYRSVRGYTLLAVIADEIAFWRSDEYSASPDKEILAAIRPGLATIPGSLLLCISSPYARRGELWKTYSRHHGKDSAVLVWQAASREMNPSLPQRVVDRAMEDDPQAASAEYFAQFRTDVETFISREAVEACVVPDRLELPPLSDVRYQAFVDPSGGSKDSMTLAISHRHNGFVVLDALRERRPPFSPASVVDEFSKTLEAYRVKSVVGDRFGGEWCREPFRSRGISYKLAEQTRSELYLALLPTINSGTVELLDNKRLISQLYTLERRTSRGGKDSVDHGPGSQDDLANAVAGAVETAKRPVIVAGTWGR